eukprot:CAMPEP_0172646764 /NCGR_PEP_ID=MMETSP1068-20121228/240403_1 /TAXON_ID=35684 /ORGANISM="Pseudopedinella elastica, Strain CCMP716" /LENGTH=174 /DNA_ID=CAMNT_0013461029 /DNA_START=1258 /DNA_END=1779 /DNA_ORIENTATION=-
MVDHHRHALVPKSPRKALRVHSQKEPPEGGPRKDSAQSQDSYKKKKKGPRKKCPGGKREGQGAALIKHRRPQELVKAFRGLAFASRVPSSSSAEGTLGKWPRLGARRHGGSTKRRGGKHCGERRHESAGVRARGEAPRRERQVQGLGPHAHLVAARGLSGCLVGKGPPAGGSVP